MPENFDQIAAAAPENEQISAMRISAQRFLNNQRLIVRELIRELREELTDLDRRIAIYDRKIAELYRTSEACQHLSMVEGIGPITATALVVRWEMLQ